MSYKERILNTIIRVQQAIPFILPNEYIAWKRYRTKFTKTCDSCNSEKGIYKITYQDYQLPSTVIYPVPVRFCPNCLSKADESVGVLSEKSSSEDEETFEINRV